MKLFNLSTVDIRIIVTLFCVVLTTAHYMWTNIPPNDSWLIFLAALSGIDVGNYIGRRVTMKNGHEGTPEGPTSAPESPVVDESEASTDVQELRNKQTNQGTEI